MPRVAFAHNKSVYRSEPHHSRCGTHSYHNTAYAIFLPQAEVELQRVDGQQAGIYAWQLNDGVSTVGIMHSHIETPSRIVAVLPVNDLGIIGVV